MNLPFTFPDLAQYKPVFVEVNGIEYFVLTGYETQSDTCWWCGAHIEQGKRKAHYCRGKSHNDVLSCFRLYHDHFDWSYASSWALRRASGKCQRCGAEEKNISRDPFGYRTNLEVHHIVPLKGSIRSFSPYNLPDNLIVLCHDCHVAAHTSPKKPKIPLEQLALLYPES